MAISTKASEIDACLRCVLVSCDETDPGCLLRIDKDKEYHRAYSREWYERNKEAVKARNAAYWKEYSKTHDRREYYRERRKNAQNVQISTP